MPGRPPVRERTWLLAPFSGAWRARSVPGGFVRGRVRFVAVVGRGAAGGGGEAGWVGSKFHAVALLFDSTGPLGGFAWRLRDSWRQGTAEVTCAGACFGWPGPGLWEGDWRSTRLGRLGACWRRGRHPGAGVRGRVRLRGIWRRGSVGGGGEAGWKVSPTQSHFLVVEGSRFAGPLWYGKLHKRWIDSGADRLCRELWLAWAIFIGRRWAALRVWSELAVVGTVRRAGARGWRGVARRLGVARGNTEARQSAYPNARSGSGVDSLGGRRLVLCSFAFGQVRLMCPVLDGSCRALEGSCRVFYRVFYRGCGSGCRSRARPIAVGVWSRRGRVALKV